MITDLVGDGRIQEGRFTASKFDINGDGWFDLVAGSDQYGAGAGVRILNHDTGNVDPNSTSILPTGLYGSKGTITNR